jgi:hypothetical protein
MAKVGFYFHDKSIIQDALSMKSKNEVGWSFIIVQALFGSWRDAPDRIGPCIGCYIDLGAFTWYASSISRILNNPSVSILMDDKEENVVEIEYIFPSKSAFYSLFKNPEYMVPGKANVALLEKVWKKFEENPQLRRVIMSVYGENQRSGSSHLMLNVVDRLDTNTFEMMFYDPQGITMMSDDIEEAIWRALYACRPVLRYSLAKRPDRCAISPQNVEDMFNDRDPNEPKGYCASWVTFTLLVSLCMGVISVDEITLDIITTMNRVDTNHPDPEKLLMFIRAFSRLFAHTWKTKGLVDLSDVRKTVCCHNKDGVWSY